MLIRSFRDSDMAQVCELLEDRRVRLNYNLPNRISSAELEEWDTENSCNHTKTLVVEVNKKIVGSGNVLGDTIDYFVAPDFWRQGIGFSLAKALCRNAFQHQYVDKVTATTFRHNVGSRKILEKLGFTFSGLTKLVNPKDANWDYIPALNYELHRNTFLW